MLRILASCPDYDCREAFKEKKVKGWLKSISAFANSKGGSVFFGIDEYEEIFSIENPGETISKIADLIKTRIDPTPVFRVVPHKLDGKDILEVVVPKGRSTPYYFCSEDEKVAFVRSYGASIPAPMHILSELILKGAGQSYDAILTDTQKGELSFSSFIKEYRARVSKDFSVKDLEKIGLAGGDFLTNAGILFADSNGVRQSRIVCSKWNAVGKVSDDSFVKGIEIAGGLLSQLDAAMSFFKENVDEKAYDEEAFKEALLNAIIHRDYSSVGTQITVNIFNDRIEISSPGGALYQKPIPEIVEGVMQSRRRNPVIADVFHKLGLMDIRGSGLADITSRTNAMFGDGKVHAFFFSDDQSFLVRIENATYEKKKEPKVEPKPHVVKPAPASGVSNEREVYYAIKKNKDVKLEQIIEITGLSRSTVLRMIQKLISKGLVIRYGSKKIGHWKVTGKRYERGR